MPLNEKTEIKNMNSMISKISEIQKYWNIRKIFMLFIRNKEK